MWLHQTEGFQCRCIKKKNVDALKKMTSKTFTAREQKPTLVRGEWSCGHEEKAKVHLSSENPSNFNDYASMPALRKMNNKVRTTNLFSIWFTEYFIPLLRSMILKKRDFLQNMIVNYQWTWMGPAQWLSG